MVDVIVIDELQKFFNLGKKPFQVEKAFNHGYWNCFKYTTELEQYLKDNKIKYKAIDWYDYKNKA